MIKNWQGAIAGLSMSESELERTRRTAKRALRIMAILFTFVYLAFFCLAAWNLMRAWQSARPENWKEFWDNTRTLFGFSAALLIWIQDPITPFIRVGTRVIAAREAAIAGDDLHAPVSAQQPEAPQTVDLVNVTRFGPLRALWQMQRSLVLVAALFIFFCGATLAATGIAVLTFTPTTTSGGALQIAGWLVVGVAAFALGGGALLLWRFYLLSRPLIVEADDWGLRWRQLEKNRPVSKSIAWHEAQAFVLLRKRGAAEEYARESAFALVGHDTTLVWLVNPTVVYGAHEQLAGLIAARTKLPLRDITKYVEQEGEEDKDVALTASVQQHTTDATPSIQVGSSLTTGGEPAAERGGCLLMTRGCLLVLLFAFVPCAPFGLLAGAGWGLQQYQSRYYGDVLSQIHAQQPVFADQLSYDDGRWPVAEDDDYHQSWFYRDGAYHLRGILASQTISAQGPESYGDAAVEATVAQMNRGQQRDLYDGVGLLLRASENNTDFVVFLVTPEGEWSLWRFHEVGDETRNWNEIAGGASDAIHEGAGERNRLLVVLHGARYLCYVNGQFLGAFEDDGPPLLQGRMGVFVNESTTEGAFSDFAVYPPPALDPLPFT